MRGFTGPPAHLASVLYKCPFPRFGPALIPQGAGFWPLLCDPVEIMAPLWALVSLICIPESWSGQCGWKLEGEMYILQERDSGWMEAVTLAIGTGGWNQGVGAGLGSELHLMVGRGWCKSGRAGSS